MTFELGMSYISDQRCQFYGFDVHVGSSEFYKIVPRGEFRPWNITSTTNKVLHNGATQGYLSKILFHFCIELRYL